jgi:putative redox protein
MTQVKVKTRTTDNYGQEIKSSAHSFLSDAPKEHGGNDIGPDPKELLLGSLGACTSITMQMYAKRKGWDLKKIDITLKEEQVDDPANPGKSVEKITREIHVEGNLESDQIESLKAIADKCPIHKLLSGPKQIVTNITSA